MECYSAIVELESRDPMIIPGVLAAATEILSSKCAGTVRSHSWSMHACGGLLAKVSAVFPGPETVTLLRPIVRVTVESSDPEAIATLVSHLVEGLESRFPGQVYSRLSA